MCHVQVLVSLLDSPLKRLVRERAQAGDGSRAPIALIEEVAVGMGNASGAEAFLVWHFAVAMEAWVQGGTDGGLLGTGG